jgi:hypothetical protein
MTLVNYVGGGAQHEELFMTPSWRLHVRGVYVNEGERG